MPRHPRQVLLFATLAALCSHAPAQGPAGGLRLFEPAGLMETKLIDSNGSIVHRWQGTNFSTAQYLLGDGSLLRAVNLGSAKGHDGLRRVGFDNTLLWDYRNPPGTATHHDIAPMPNGNVLMIAWDKKITEVALANGRDPNITLTAFWLVKIVEVQPTGPTSGQIVWEWRLWDHLIQDFDPQMANFGVVADHPELLDINFPAQKINEFNHANGIDYDPVHDWIVLSSLRQDEIYIIDHSTTTAEAAGHSGGRRGKGGDLLYRWGNPRAYRVPQATRALFGQHAPRFVPPGYPGEGHLTVFNNRFVTGVASAVFELELPLDANDNFIPPPAGGQYAPPRPIWSYQAPGFYSDIMSSAERLPNGNTLVCSATQRWLFEVTPAGQTVWQHRTNEGRIFHAHHTSRALWASTDTTSASNGGRVDFDLLEGTAAAGDPYLLLCSASGTANGFTFGGVTVPLDLDAMLLASAQYANLPPVFVQTFGTLDSMGHAQASFTVLPGFTQVGFRLDFAHIQFDASTLAPVRASNTVPMVTN